MARKMSLAARLLALAEGWAIHSWRPARGGAPPLRSRREGRVNAPCAGAVDLHVLDALHCRRVFFAAVRVDELLDAGALRLALESAVAEFPPTAGWLESAPRGGLRLRWDGARKRRGLAWTEAEAGGAPPEGPFDGVGLQNGGLLPRLKGRSVVAAQVTRFPDAGATMVVVSFNHSLGDIASAMEFLQAWCAHADAAAAPGGKGAATAPAGAPAAAAKAAARPLACGAARWDRSVLRRATARCEGGSAGASAGAARSDDGASADGAASSAAASTGGGSSIGSLDSGASSCYWDGKQIWRRDPTSRIPTCVTAAKWLWINPESRAQTWLLPRTAIDALRARLGAAGARAALSANDVVSALALAAAAWLDPARVEARGGANLHVVVNGRGGRFGAEVPHDYFGNFSVLAPVWVPAELLLNNGDGDSDTAWDDATRGGPLPSPELAAHVHVGVRAALGPGGVAARRNAWATAETEGGRVGAVRGHELADLFDGDVCVDNVASFPVHALRFGAKNAPSSATMRFIPIPRLLWVSAAGPPSAGNATGGDLHLSLQLPASQWARLAPAWESAGLSLVSDVSAVTDVVAHPGSLRAMFSELLRNPLASI
ncbi:hypothetical protein Rsub_07430 [Raphidocelis subcapitata]|uniref:Acetyltransferase n=1 Tax=Raphidocelis subcapitata TaxID=307507 RepID=A0A2V0P499_9CHLO|nr:hypothetical protein Rsub_07430 [Raphidocelis subcapitata]|eukprot:GBF94694.1 hypothetical protein Rsub_07430 [Raphidocelis subcapitata]